MLDVTRAEQVTAAVNQTARALGAIDVLVNNAGITLDRPTVEVTDDEWESVIATNLTAMFRLARAVAPGMIARGRGKIINVGSMYGALGVPRHAATARARRASTG
jgi:3-oxoacyl-[acyl-carrier protein] reductase